MTIAETAAVALTNDYAERRADFLRKFDQKAPVDGSKSIERSPSGRYVLETVRYSSGPATWDYSRGVVTEIASGRVIADVKRNLGHFWHAWIFRSEHEEFLLCGEDYQGYSVIDLTTAQTHVEFAASGFDGRGFCWASVQPSPDGTILAVDGCYWACPEELVFFDFSNPSVLPLPELFRVSAEYESGDWAIGDGINRDEFHYRVEAPRYEDDPTPPMIDAVWRRPDRI
jgi:hypothetical protein